MKNGSYSGGIVVTIIKLCIAAFIGFVFLSFSASLMGAILAVLIYGFALIVEAIRELKQ